MTSTESRPRVSVVMTAYKHSEFIPKAIDSILSQDLAREPGAVELVLVNDGSPEDIEAVIEPYRDKLVYIAQENQGLGAARNTGWRAARGEYIAFCDSDDIHLPFRLSCHAALLDQCPDAALACGELAIYENGEVTSPTTLRDRPGLGPLDTTFDRALERDFGGWKTAAERGLPIPEEYRETRVYQGRVPHLVATYHFAWGGASMYRRSALEETGGHDDRFRRWTEWHLVSILSKSHEIVHLDCPVLWYRQHGGQLTKQAKDGAEVYQIVCEVWKSDRDFAARHRDILARVVQRAAMRLAHYETGEGKYSAARKHIIDSLRLNPLDHHGYSALARTVVKQAMDRIRRTRQR